jgi:hypothetical protein
MLLDAFAINFLNLTLDIVELPVQEFLMDVRQRQGSLCFSAGDF